MVIEKLNDDGIDLNDCRGQAYNNAAVMSGVRTGVYKNEFWKSILKLSLSIAKTTAQIWRVFMQLKFIQQWLLFLVLWTKFLFSFHVRQHVGKY